MKEAMKGDVTAAGVVVGIFIGLFIPAVRAWLNTEPSACDRIDSAYIAIEDFSTEYSEGFFEDDRLVTVKRQLEELYSGCQPIESDPYD